MLLEDVAIGIDILAIVNAERHDPIADLFSKLQGIVDAFKVKDEERRKMDEELKRLRSVLQSAGAWGLFGAWDIEDVARLDLYLQSNSLPLWEEKQIVKRIALARRVIPAHSRLQNDFWRLNSAFFGLRSDGIAAKRSLYHLLGDDNGYGYERVHGMSRSLPCPRQRSYSVCSDSFWGDAYYQEPDSSNDMEGCRHENHARRRPCRGDPTKGGREAASRLRRSGKVRPRGGRHKGDERAELTGGF